MAEKKTKDKYIHVRIEEEFKNKLMEILKENGLTISTLVNMLLHQYYDQNKK